MKKFAPILTKFAGKLKDHRYWEIMLCGDKICLAKRLNYTIRKSGHIHTSAAPTMYFLFETNSEYSAGKYRIIWTGRASTHQLAAFGALWYRAELAGQLPSIEEVELVLPPV